MDRREFLARSTAAAAWPSVAATAQSTAMRDGTSPSVTDRDAWIAILRRIADPVLDNLANGTLKARMPVEQAAGANRAGVTHLEAIGRLLAGMAPWLALPDARTPEAATRSRYVTLARRAIAAIVDPSSPDVLNFTEDRQPLVDAAFLAQAIVRAPAALGGELDASTKSRLVAALESARAIVPAFNNWLLFSAMVEAGLKTLGAQWDRVRVDYALRQHDAWYKGDGVYGDGPELHVDYYNSFVIHPMLVDVLSVCGNESAAWKELAPRVDARARRHAAIQERVIAPDGSFPAVGRSIAYRCGAFHLLAQAALRRALPEGVAPAQVRGALTAVIRRTMDAPQTFDDGGWLRIGLCGHQPGIGEPYISTGSLYLCAVAFLPLGLPATDEFWNAPPQPWTGVKAWSGQAFPIDHAL
jgi:hypothetical protein